MRRLRARDGRLELRALALGAFALCCLLAFAPTAAQATLLPAGFFDAPVDLAKGAVKVEADRLDYDSRHGTITAVGNVHFSDGGYSIAADSLTYEQKTGTLTATGHVVMHSPNGEVYNAASVQVDGPLRTAFIQSLTVTTAEGARITADDAHYGDALQTILTNAAYSPCGLCVDKEGRKIGWQVKAARMIYDRANASVTMEQPSLALLGVPVAWLPWFWVPDPTQPRATGLRMPSIGGDGQRGVTLTVPYFVPVGEDVDVILSPTLMSRQGAMLAGDLKWRLPDSGEIDVSAEAGTQLDPGAYAGTVGDRSWRGAFQTSAHFTPTAQWTAGWSYTTFTDDQYLSDYEGNTDSTLTNDLYATHLTNDTWFDARIQSFRPIGNFTAADDDKQALVLPKLSYDHVQDLAPGYGRLHLTGELLDVSRAADDTNTFNGVPYDFGLAGDKQHLAVEGGWENQFILPGGLTATPYLAGRLDVANYDGGSLYAGPPPAPPASFLFSATPIAALDMRWPLIATDGGVTHLVEPIAQIVYRGSDTTQVGITNDDAQSFVFDDTNLFTYDHFSGIDRQDTGLRANLGGHYLGNFADGSWLDFVAGQSFQLAGVNAFDVTDTAQVGTSTGLGSTASYFVAGARGGFNNGLSFGGKLQVDTMTPTVTRAGLGVNYAPGVHQFSAGGDYIYAAADPALGVVNPEHQISGHVGVPVTDYWTVSGSLAYDLVALNWASVSAGATYDDGYLTYGASANATPTSWGLGVQFKLHGPDGTPAF